MGKQYWWFCGKDRKLRFGDGRAVEAGVTHTVTKGLVHGLPVMHFSGLHACASAVNAMEYYGTGPVACLVELGGKVIHANGISVATERKYLAVADVSDAIREWARYCAKQVSLTANMSLPSSVQNYIDTGDESVADEARCDLLSFTDGKYRYTMSTTESCVLQVLHRAMRTDPLNGACPFAAYVAGTGMSYSDYAKQLDLFLRNQLVGVC